MMTRQEWEKYERLKHLHDRRPGLFGLRLGLLLLGSFVVVAAVLLLIVYLFAIALKDPLEHLTLLAFLLINLGISVYMYVRGLLNRPWAEMLYLPEKDHPELYRKVNWVAHLMRAPHIHRIYLNHEFNMAVATVNLFLPGLRRNVLMLGWPLLCVLSSKGLIGTLAHEFGHLSGRHPFGGALFWRVGLFWQSLYLGVFSIPLYLYAAWFLRHLARYRLPVRYAEEESADRFVSNTFGDDHLLECLTKLVVGGAILNDGAFWAEAVEAVENPDAVDRAERIRQALQRPFPDDESKRLLEKALKAIHPVTEEHPPFAERVGHRSADELLPYLKTEPDALKKLVGDPAKLEEGLRTLEDDPFLRIWVSMKEMKDEADRFDPASADPQAWSVQLERLDTLGRTEAGGQLLKEAMARFPKSVSLQALDLLRRMEAASDEEGAACAAKLEKLTEFHPLLANEIDEALLAYYLDRGRGEAAKHWLELRAAAQKATQRQTEAPLAPEDDLRPTSLSDSVLRDFLECMIPFASEIKEVYLIDRYYDPAITAVSSFLLVVRKRKFLTSTYDSDLLESLKSLADDDYHVVIARAKMIEWMHQRQIEPIPILDEAAFASRYPKPPAP